MQLYPFISSLHVCSNILGTTSETLNKLTLCFFAHMVKCSIRLTRLPTCTYEWKGLRLMVKKKTGLRNMFWNPVQRYVSYNCIHSSVAKCMFQYRAKQQKHWISQCCASLHECFFNTTYGKYNSLWPTRLPTCIYEWKGLKLLVKKNVIT